MTEVPAAIGIDIGGTNLRMALVSSRGMLLEHRRAASPRASVEDFLDTLLGVHGDLTAGLGDPDLPVGLGVASLVRDRRTAIYGPNLGIGEIDLVDALGQRGLGRVVVENDASAAMYGEWKAGAARDHDDALMVTLGTGVGGGAVVHGRLLQGANGFAGEAGHTSLEVDGRPCACGRRGCLEAYASGSAIAVTAREFLARGQASALSSLDVVTGQDVTRAAIDGDAVAIAVLEQTGAWLGVGLTGMVNLLDPAIVVVGGGVVESAGRWILPAAQGVLASQIEGHRLRLAPRLVVAALGDHAGMVGAAMLALDQTSPDLTSPDLT